MSWGQQTRAEKKQEAPPSLPERPSLVLRSVAACRAQPPPRARLLPAKRARCSSPPHAQPAKEQQQQPQQQQPVGPQRTPLLRPPGMPAMMPIGSVRCRMAEEPSRDPAPKPLEPEEKPLFVKGTGWDRYYSHSPLLRNIYKRRNPKKLEVICEFFMKYRGKERQLYEKVCKKYNETPLPVSETEPKEEPEATGAEPRPTRAARRRSRGSHQPTAAAATAAATAAAASRPRNLQRKWQSRLGRPPSRRVGSRLRGPPLRDGCARARHAFIEAKRGVVAS